MRPVLEGSDSLASAARGLQERIRDLTEGDGDDGERGRSSEVLAGRTERRALSVRRGENLVVTRLRTRVVRSTSLPEVSPMEERGLQRTSGGSDTCIGIPVHARSGGRNPQLSAESGATGDDDAVLPHGSQSWKMLLPGAILVGIGVQVAHGLVVYLLAPKLDKATSLYGALGIATTLLFFLWIVGWIIITAPILNRALADAIHEQDAALMLIGALASGVRSVRERKRTAQSAHHARQRLFPRVVR
jgi:hypothetical protein